MNNSTLDIIKSPEAKRMLEMVTSDFYNDSRTALWMYEAIGREYDDMAKWSRELKRETLPQTCTWSIVIWEFIYDIESDDALPLEYRRNQLMAKRWSNPPINPARIEFALSLLLGLPVEITDPVAPYTFMVEIYEEENVEVDYKIALKRLRKIKPSHLSFELWCILVQEYTVYDYSAGAISEIIEEEFVE